MYFDLINGQVFHHSSPEWPPRLQQFVTQGLSQPGMVSEPQLDLFKWTWCLPWNSCKLLQLTRPWGEVLCQLNYTSHEPLPPIFIWCPLFLLLEVWVPNYSLLLDGSTIFFTHLLICLFSKLKSHSLRYHVSYRSRSVPSIIPIGLFWSFSSSTRSFSRWKIWTNQCTEFKLWAYNKYIQ